MPFIVLKVTLDGAASVYTPLIRENQLLTLFFIPFLLVVSVIFMNLVTAVVIDVFIENNKKDQAKLSSCLNVDSVIELFDALDADGSGEVSIHEFCQGVAQLAVSGPLLEATRTLKLLQLIRHDLGVVGTSFGLDTAHFQKNTSRLLVERDATFRSTIASHSTWARSGHSMSAINPVSADEGKRTARDSLGPRRGPQSAIRTGPPLSPDEGA